MIDNKFHHLNRSDSRTPSRGHLFGCGFILGAFIAFCLEALGVTQSLHGEALLPLMALSGGLVGLTRARTLVWILSAVFLAGVLVVMYTPLASHLTPRLVRSDRLAPCPAVVVLSASVHKDKALNAAAQSRVLQGFYLLRRHYAERLVLTQATVPYGSQAPTVRRQMQLLGINVPVDEVGPVSDTHDEALAVARLAHARGWKRVILVTHPWHMRRAAAAFEKAGLPVLCSPCIETEYDLSALNKPGNRLHAFRDWLHEEVGYYVYKRHGWV